MGVLPFASKFIRYLSYLLGSLVLFVFLAIIIGETVTSLSNSERPLMSLSTNETILFVFLGIALVGLMIAYFKMKIGGIITVIGAIGFIINESIDNKFLMSLEDGFFFYLLLICGLLYATSGILRDRFQTTKGK